MAKTKTFVLSDESVNTYGFRVLLSGIDLAQFNRNPVLYHNHDDWSAPIGRWENIRVEDGRLIADPVFDLDDEDGRKIAGKVERGFLRMASIGFRVVERSEDPALMLPGQTSPTVTKCMLREASIVGIGANHNAIRLYDENDRPLSDAEMARLFDNNDNKPDNNKKNDLKMKKETRDLLALADNATEEQLHDAVNAVVNENVRLKEEVTTLSGEINVMKGTRAAERKAEAVKRTDAAILGGRLNAAAREATLKQFELDFDAAKTMLDNIPARQSLKDAVGSADQSEADKFCALSWDELDRSGKLPVLKDKYPDIYKEKFDEKFKK